jgi:hypothetical protein
MENQPMSETHKGLPVAGYVAGYTGQPDWKVKLVNTHKIMEEQILRHLDGWKTPPDYLPAEGMELDQRWLSIARTHIEQGFMALNRAVFRPERVKL